MQNDRMIFAVSNTDMEQNKKRRGKVRYSLGVGVVTHIGVQGRKTGVTAKGEVTKDFDNLENVDDFFASDGEEYESDEEIEQIDRSEKLYSKHKSQTKEEEILFEDSTVTFDSVDEPEEDISGTTPHKASLPEKQSPIRPVALALEFEDEEDVSGNEDSSPISFDAAGSYDDEPEIEAVAEKEYQKESKRRDQSESESEEEQPRRKLYEDTEEWVSDCEEKENTEPKENTKLKKNTNVKKTKRPIQRSKAKDYVDDDLDELLPRMERMEIRKMDKMYAHPNKEATPGTRRSRRLRITPLEYWRNERVIYGNDEQDTTFHTIVDVIKLPPSPPRTRSKAQY